MQKLGQMKVQLRGVFKGPGLINFVYRMFDRLGHCMSLLVRGLEHFLLYHILGISSSQLTFIFFRGVETTKQITHLISEKFFFQSVRSLEIDGNWIIRVESLAQEHAERMVSFASRTPKIKERFGQRLKESLGESHGWQQLVGGTQRVSAVGGCCPVWVYVVRADMVFQLLLAQNWSRTTAV